MPNPSNSDLVGEARALAERSTSPGSNGLNAWLGDARRLLPELAQQLEQAEQRIENFERHVEREIEPKLMGRAERYREALSLALMHIEDPRACAAVRAALTPDEGADQEKPRLVYCARCHKEHAVMPADTPCAPGAWSDVLSEGADPGVS